MKTLFILNDPPKSSREIGGECNGAAIENYV